MALIQPTRRQAGGAARAIGLLFTTGGVLMALLPLLLLGFVLWTLGRGALP